MRKVFVRGDVVLAAEVSPYRITVKDCSQHMWVCTVCGDELDRGGIVEHVTVTCEGIDG